jgi:hypothetical protein
MKRSECGKDCDDHNAGSALRVRNVAVRMENGFSDQKSAEELLQIGTGQRMRVLERNSSCGPRFRNFNVPKLREDRAVLASVGSSLGAGHRGMRHASRDVDLVIPAFTNICRRHSAQQQHCAEKAKRDCPKRFLHTLPTEHSIANHRGKVNVAPDAFVRSCAQSAP